MSVKTVYLIGHGRVDRVRERDKIQLPPKITMHWLAPLGDTTIGLSTAFMGGNLLQEEGSDPPGTSIFPHYLCADMNVKHDEKITAFFRRGAPDPQGCADPYVLYPRDKINLPLLSIFAFLKMLSPEEADWHVYWTCCRGFIGVANPTESVWEAGQKIRSRPRQNPPKTPALDNREEKHKTLDADFKSIIMVAKSDQTALQGDIAIGRPTGGINKHLGIITRRGSFGGM
jgi:hypothetical protein